MVEYLKRTWTEIDLDAIVHNYKKIEAATSAKMMPVIKADAYGHGATPIAKEYEKLGAAYFAVSSLDEAMQLRNGGITTPILILGYTPPTQTQELLEAGISQTVYDETMAGEFSARAQALGKKLTVHIKIDTGMSRLGLRFHDETETGCAEQILRIASMPGLWCEGICTHFTSADEADNPFTLRQFALFSHLLSAVERRGVTFSLRHCANSAAVENFKETPLDLVRPGIILYGLAAGEKESSLDLRPAMQLISVVSSVHELQAGDCVSYGQTFRASGPMRVATVPIGYADGYPRKLSGVGKVQIGGKWVPVLGRVCMDQCVVDISAVEGTVSPGDRVVLMGGGYGAKEIADLCGTINYEIVCGISKRVPRLFLKGGEVVEKIEYLL